MRRFVFFGWVVVVSLVVLASTDASAQDRLPSARPASSMLEMTAPEFASTMASANGVVLLPIGAIEEHGTHLPLSTDIVTAVGQCQEVARLLRSRGTAIVVGPPLNIGITSESGDFRRSGTYGYPGSLTVRAETFVQLYVDVIRSLHDNGARTVFLYSSHAGSGQLRAVADIADQASREIEGLTTWALVASENVATFGLDGRPRVVPMAEFRNFPLLTEQLGAGTEAPRTTHGDGAETSTMLFFRPDLVRPGYAQLPQSPSSAFLRAAASGDQTQNPSGIGGFPFSRASAAVGERLLEVRTARMADAIQRTLASPRP